MIPIIDFHDKNAEQQMYDAYTTCGFAVFTHTHDSWLSEFADWGQIVKEYFALPTEVKLKNGYSGVIDNVGYSGIEDERLTPYMPGDLKECYNWVSPDRMQEKYWPTDIPEFKPMAQKIERITRMIAHEFLYKFENIFKLPHGTLVEKHIDGSSTMRLIHYPVWENDNVKENQIRGGEHTDYGSLTLLWRFDDPGGLQVQDRQTDEWIDAPYIENSLVLNVADMFARWSNDILKSSNHRIINTDLTKPRYTMPFFLDPGRDVMIENFTDQPSIYPPIKSYDYLKWRLSLSYDPTIRRGDGTYGDDYAEDLDIRKEGIQHLPFANPDRLVLSRLEIDNK